MLDAFSNINIRIFYAMKVNYNPHCVKIIKDAGIDAVSPNEVKMALSLGYTSEQIIFTPSNPTGKEMKIAGDQNNLFREPNNFLF